MKKLVILLVTSFAISYGYSQTRGIGDSVFIIPRPVSFTLQKGYFILKPETVIISAGKNATDVSSFLSELLHENYGFSIKNNREKNLSAKSFISLSINKSANKLIGDEGYTLRVTAQKVVFKRHLR